MASELFWDPRGRSYEKPPDAEVTRRESAYALVVSEEDEVLMVMPKWNDQWELPGGGIEAGESIHDGLQREFYEETRYSMEQISDTPIYVGKGNFYEPPPRNRYYHSVMKVYPARLVSKERDECCADTPGANEIKKVGWIKLLDLNKQNCQMITWPVIRKLQQEQNS